MIHIEPDDLTEVREILERHVPRVPVYIFGSRSHGRQLKPFSDLDICLKGEKPVPTSTISGLKDAFAESNLPFKVDVVDWQALPDYFREVIAVDLRPLTKPVPSP